MFNTLSSALSRRRVLMGLGAACAAATATHEAGAATVAENPRLLALGDALPTTLAAYQGATDKVARTVAEWSPQWPKPDEKIMNFGSGKSYRGIDGRGIEVKLATWVRARVPDVGTPEHYETELADRLKDIDRIAATKSQRGMKFQQFWAQRNRDAIEPARFYWSEVDRITAASGIEAAKQAKEEARRALHALVSEIMTEKETSIAGVVVKAQALAAWGSIDPFYQLTNVQAPEWAANIAAAIMRQGGVT